MKDIPKYNSKKLSRALVRLGFFDAKGGKHRYKFKHPTIIPDKPARPFIVFPADIKKDNDFQKQIIKDIIRYWHIPEDKVIEALK